MTIKTCEQQMEMHRENPKLLNFWTDKRARMIAKYDKYLHLRKEVKDEEPKPEVKKSGKTEKPKVSSLAKSKGGK